MRYAFGALAALLLTACGASSYLGIDLKSVPTSASAIEVQSLAQRAEGGDKNARLTLARRFRDGDGVPQSQTLACEAYRGAAAVSSRTQTTFICDGACESVTTHIGDYNKGILEALEEAEALGCGLEWDRDRQDAKFTTAANLASEFCVGMLDELKVGDPKCHSLLAPEQQTLVAFHIGLVNCDQSVLGTGPTIRERRTNLRACMQRRPDLGLNYGQARTVIDFEKALRQLVRCETIERGSSGTSTRCELTPDLPDGPIEIGASSDSQWSMLMPIIEQSTLAKAEEPLSTEQIFARRAVRTLCRGSQNFDADEKIMPLEREICFLWWATL